MDAEYDSRERLRSEESRERLREDLEKMEDDLAERRAEAETEREELITERARFEVERAHWDAERAHFDAERAHFEKTAKVTFDVESGRRSVQYGEPVHFHISRFWKICKCTVSIVPRPDSPPAWAKGDGQEAAVEATLYTALIKEV